MTSAIKTAARYIIFAIFATIGNIGAQESVSRIYAGGYGLIIAILCGTAAGLIIKYILDKRYIFQHSTASKTQEGAAFFLYSLTGVFTTAIFWGFEATFVHIFASKEMQYLGAVIGLTLGYIIKYQMDKYWVFKRI